MLVLYYISLCLATVILDPFHSCACFEFLSEFKCSEFKSLNVHPTPTVEEMLKQKTSQNNKIFLQY